MLSEFQDAHGRMTYEHYLGVDTPCFIERDDGLIQQAPNAEMYFAKFEDWPKYEREAMAYVRGRTLDVGCGAGRAALHLQECGHTVVGIDNSPLAVKTCRLRGLRRVHVLPVTRVNRRLGRFDTILMLGNNFGLMENEKRTRWLLSRLSSITNDDARIVAATLDPYETEDPIHLRYHKRNIKSGRMVGQIRIRVRYQTYKTPWFDYLFVSRPEMEVLLVGTPWKIERFIDSEGPFYIALLRKKAVRPSP